MAQVKAMPTIRTIRYAIFARMSYFREDVKDGNLPVLFFAHPFFTLISGFSKV
jgi:hypothetical protein